MTTINAQALLELRKLQPCPLPPAFQHFTQGTALFCRAVHRLSEKGQPSNRVLLLTRQCILLCSEAGETRRVIAIQSILSITLDTEGTTTKVQFHIPESYDLLVAFHHDPRNSVESTVDEFLRLFQILARCWTGKEVPVQNAPIKPSTSLKRPSHVGREVPSVATVASTIGKSQEPPSPPPQPQMMTNQQPQQPTSALPPQLMYVNPPTPPSHLTAGGAGGGVQSTFSGMPMASPTPMQQPSMMSMIPYSKFPTAEEEAQLLDKIAALREENSRLQLELSDCLDILDRKNEGMEEAARLKTQIQAEKAALHKVRLQGKAERVLATMIASICFNKFHSKAAKYDGDCDAFIETRNVKLKQLEQTIKQLEELSLMQKAQIANEQQRGKGIQMAMPSLHAAAAPIGGHPTTQHLHQVYNAVLGQSPNHRDVLKRI